MKKLFLLATLLVIAFSGSAFAANPAINLESAIYLDDKSPVTDLEAIQPYREVAFTYAVTADTGSISYIGSISTQSQSGTLKGDLVGGPFSITPDPIEFSSEESGTISITVTDGNSAKASISTTVKAIAGTRPDVPVTGIGIKLASDFFGTPKARISLTLNADDSEQEKIEAEVTPGNATNKKVLWSSDNEAVATVDSSGTVKGVTSGDAVITATTEDGGYKATCDVTVRKSASPTFTLQPFALRVSVGHEREVKLESEQIWPTIDWVIVNTEIASVSQPTFTSCQVTGLKEGTTTLVVTGKSPLFPDTTFTASCDITVTKAGSYSIDLYPESLNLEVGEVDWNIKATYEPAGTLTGEYYLWSVSKPEFIEAETYGDGNDHYDIFKAFKAGEAVITVKLMSADHQELASATCNITVTDPAQPSVTIDLSELGLYNDTMDVWEGDTVDLWISGTPSGLTFSAEGLPQGLTLSPQGHLYGTIPMPAAGEYPVRYYTVTIEAKTASDEFTSESFTLAVKTPDDSGSSDSGGSGGCNAGFAGLGLSLAGLLCLKKRIGR